MILILENTDNIWKMSTPSPKKKEGGSSVPSTFKLKNTENTVAVGVSLVSNFIRIQMKLLIELQNLNFGLEIDEIDLQAESIKKVFFFLVANFNYFVRIFDLIPIRTTV